MASRISDEMPAAPSDASASELAVLKLPSFLHEPFSAALSQSMLLPAFVALFGIVAALFVLGGLGARSAHMDADDDITDEIPVYDDGYDDDDYVEYVVEPTYRPAPAPEPVRRRDRSDRVAASGRGARTAGRPAG